MTEAGNPTIIAARGVLPEHRYPQPAITAAFAELAAPEQRSKSGPATGRFFWALPGPARAAVHRPGS